jgi:hypothetical protein
MRKDLILVGLILLMLPIGTIADCPTTRQLVCVKKQVHSTLADCYLEMNRFFGFKNYRQTFAEIQKSNVMRVDYKSYYYRDKPDDRKGYRHDQPKIIPLHPLFLINQTDRAYKLERIVPYQSITSKISAQINQFLSGPELKLKIDLMDLAWLPNQEGGGSRELSQHDHLSASLFFIPLYGAFGLAVMLIGFASDKSKLD